MLRIPKVLFSLLFVALSVTAGEITVVKISELTKPEDGVFTAPKLSPDNRHVVFSGTGYNGLYAYDLTGQLLTQLTDASGAGFMFAFSPGGDHVIYRSHVYKGMRRFFSLENRNIKTGNVEILEEDQRELSAPTATADGKLHYVKDNRLNTRNLAENINSAETNGADAAVYIKDRNIALYRNGTETILQPLGEGIYLWPSLSPDGTKILFKKAKRGTFISDLQGNILSELGHANAAEWSPDGEWIVYMVDEDDGYFYTASDIYVKSVGTLETYPVTQTDDIIEMYPSWGPDNSRIVFCSVQGRIYMAEINENK